MTASAPFALPERLHRLTPNVHDLRETIKANRSIHLADVDADIFEVWGSSPAPLKRIE